MSADGVSSCLVNALCEYEDNVVTIYTEGCSNTCGFTGLLTHVSCDCVKLVSCTNGGGCRSGCRFATVTVFPIDKIVAVTRCNTTI
jgi:hypothetical protein